VVEILAPADGTIVPLDTPLDFEATADDYEDGDISTAISWSSDVDGDLGNGANTLMTLSGGTPPVTHVVTASVTDSASNTSTASITVHVDDTPAPTSISIVDLDGAGVSARGNKWRADVTISVRDDLGDPVAGAVVSGVWSNGANGSDNCTTNGAGLCSASKGGLKGNVSSVTFTVTGISGSVPYDPNGNTDPESDSNGTTISVDKP